MPALAVTPARRRLTSDPFPAGLLAGYPDHAGASQSLPAPERICPSEASRLGLSITPLQTGRPRRSCKLFRQALYPTPQSETRYVTKLRRLAAVALTSTPDDRGYRAADRRWRAERAGAGDCLFRGRSSLRRRRPSGPKCNVGSCVRRAQFGPRLRLAADPGSIGVVALDRSSRLEPILEIRVADDNAPLFLHYDHRELGTDAPLGWIVENRVLRCTLIEHARSLPNLRLLAPLEVEAVEASAAGATATLSDGQRITVRLVAAADGAHSRLRRAAGIRDPRMALPADRNCYDSPP